ncbi:hypothetical protein FD51_GL002149 [Lacticaseibacillus zeae DSM 20178 = KCTC 3804]|uniref:Uncharacterized protein n=1 Tax=Lacticaseibacillus zeae DSM 20178 = KCTC 3804 TaxID=1423816 RepID=A0A0R1EYX5_LACZE|nr:hypothetical protein FD51_GL002149 [Lacticaseibacillus zeae DSM 20178 = KCTC 3804]
MLFSEKAIMNFPNQHQTLAGEYFRLNSKMFTIVEITPVASSQKPETVFRILKTAPGFCLFLRIPARNIFC